MNIYEINYSIYSNKPPKKQSKFRPKSKKPTKTLSAVVVAEDMKCARRLFWMAKPQKGWKTRTEIDGIFNVNINHTAKELKEEQHDNLTI